MSCIINKPKDVIAFIKAYVQYSEIMLSEFRNIADSPQINTKMLLDALLFRNEFDFKCSNGKEIKLGLIKDMSVSFKLGGLKPTEIETEKETVMNGGDILLNGTILHSDTAISCNGTLALEDVNFNPRKKVTLNERQLTPQEIEAINGNIFTRCASEAKIEIATFDITDDEIEDMLEDMNVFDLRKAAKDLIEDVLDDLVKFKSYEAKDVYILERCVDAPEPKSFNISCAGISEYVFVEDIGS